MCTASSLNYAVSSVSNVSFARTTTNALRFEIKPISRVHHFLYKSQFCSLSDVCLFFIGCYRLRLVTFVPVLVFMGKFHTLLCRCIPPGLKSRALTGSAITFSRQLIRQEIWAPLASVYILSLPLIWKDSLLWNIKQKTHSTAYLWSGACSQERGFETLQPTRLVACRSVCQHA